MWLVRVELPGACLGFEAIDDGRIIETALFGAWTVGKNDRQVVAYYRQRVAWRVGGRSRTGPGTQVIRFAAANESGAPWKSQYVSAPTFDTG
jgi:hypothetical protein